MPARPALTREHIRQSNLIEGFDDPERDERDWESWTYLRNQLRDRPLSHNTICELNRRITAGQEHPDSSWFGTYRDRSGIEVSVNGVPAMAAAHVQRAMNDWLDRYYTDNPKDSHIEFEKIHPFIDGNGRTGRMLFWCQQLMRGRQPTLITYRNKSRYYRWFE